MGELAADLRRLGHEVTVLTTVPHYNPGDAAATDQRLRRYWGRLLQRSEYHGIPVYHAAMPAKGRSVALRVLGWVWFHAISILAGVLLVRRPDVILTPSPPLTNGAAAWLLGVLRRVPFVYNVQEIYPDIAINLGALRNRWLIAALRGLERFVYGRASVITVIAPRMRQRLLEKGVTGDKVHVIPNFVDLDRLRAVERPNVFSVRHRIDEAFVVNYSGNLGPAQGLDTVLDAARLLRDRPGIRFLLIGDGILRADLEQRIEAEGLGAVTVLPYQPNALMPEIYGSADLCLVPQAALTGSDAIPSKTYRIMACERPILATTEPTSDLATLVQTAGAGVVVPPGDAEALANAIGAAASDPVAWREIGRRGRAHVQQHYGRAQVSARYSALLGAVAGAPRPRRLSEAG
jgi:colanic acid biosynthesis glycosyl transferase WcaI